jgi:hypothetical protein
MGQNMYPMVPQEEPSDAPWSLRNSRYIEQVEDPG